MWKLFVCAVCVHDLLTCTYGDYGLIVCVLSLCLCWKHLQASVSFGLCGRFLCKWLSKYQIVCIFKPLLYLVSIVQSMSLPAFKEDVGVMESLLSKRTRKWEVEAEGNMGHEASERDCRDREGTQWETVKENESPVGLIFNFKGLLLKPAGFGIYLTTRMCNSVTSTTGRL